MDPIVTSGLISAGLPLVAGVVVFLVAGVKGKDAGAATAERDSVVGGTGMKRSWVAPLVMMVACVAVHAWFFRPMELRPAQSTDWFPYIAVAAGLLGMFEGLRATPGAVRTIVRLLLFVGVGYACARSKIANGAWSSGDAAAWIGGFGAVGVLTMFAVERTTLRRAGVAGASSPLVMCGGAAGLLVAAMASLNLAQEVAPIAAILGGFCVAALVRRAIVLGPGAAHVPVYVTGAAVFQGILYGGSYSLPGWLAWVCAACVAISPWFAMMADAGAIGRLTGWKQAAARITLAAIPIVGAFGTFFVLDARAKANDPYAMVVSARP